MRIACVGSRNITVGQRELFIEIGKYIVSNHHYISSGNCDGADFCFATGSNLIDPSKVILYLPWKTYNKQYLHPDNKILYEPKDEWYGLTAPFHPGWGFLSQGCKRLMARNFGIIHRADKCIALLNHKKKGFGGTGQAWRIAESMDIPRLDLNNQDYGSVIKFLST